MKTEPTPMLAAVDQPRLVRPRVRCHSKGRHHFRGAYKGYAIDIRREHLKDPWYIQVSNEDGYAYDGWWTTPAHEDRIATRREAIEEAIRGSLLWPNARAVATGPQDSEPN